MKLPKRPETASPIIPEDLLEASGVAKPRPKKARTAHDGALFFRVNKEVVRQFHVLCAELGEPRNKMASEALNLLFARYGKPQIADKS